MNHESWMEFGAFGVGCASLGLTYLRTAQMQNGERQRARALEDAIVKLVNAESVSALASRLDALEGQVKLVATALTRVAVIDVKLDGLDRLVTREPDEIEHGLRGLQGRRIDPAPAPRGRKTATG